MRTGIIRALSFLLAVICSMQCASAAPTHPPMRLLPEPSVRPLPQGVVRFVDVDKGNDHSDGSRKRPWKTLARATRQLSAGTTLCLRGGVYYEQLQCHLRGTRQAPITIRSFPGELAIIDGGYAEFAQTPSAAWEPAPEGVDGEFRSRKEYSIPGARADGTNLLGNFADSMIPLHGYRFLTDLRSDNHLFRKLEGSKTAQGNGLYCGPGVYFNSETSRIHVRLAHTNQPSLGDANNYRGETDPRRVALVIAGRNSPLTLDRAEHVILQDIVVRGSRQATIELRNCSNITLDNVTSYGGASALRVAGTSGLRCVDSAFRGIAAPWLWRWSLKYRSIEARIVSASQWNPPARGNRDFEFARCEFTDCVDGVFLGNVENVSIHHCLLDNLSDDGFFITCRTAYDGSTPGGDFELHHNRISRVLSALAFGVGHGRQRTIDEKGGKQLGKQTIIRNNVFDLRGPVQYQQPESGPITTYGRLAGDHGSPAWEPIDFVQNTVHFRDSPWRNYYAAGLSKAMGHGTRRRIERNMFLHESGMPGQVLPTKQVDLIASSNLHWRPAAEEADKEQFLAKFRKSPLYQSTNWTKDDMFTPPEKAPNDVGAGRDVAIGVRGRMWLYGDPNVEPAKPVELKPFLHAPRIRSMQRAAIVMGYPAFDAPLLQFAFEKAGFEVDVYDRQWLPAKEFEGYSVVAILGSTVRAKMTPSGFAEDEHATLRAYLEQGGKLLIGRELFRQLFPGEAGSAFVETMLGRAPPVKTPSVRLVQPNHPWVKHLHSRDWIGKTPFSLIRLGKAGNLIGSTQTHRSALAKVKVGRGHLIYVGWDIARFLPSGRRPSSLAEEAAYQQQYQIYERIANSLFAQ